MVCKACEKEIKDNAKFCANCGAKIEPVIEEPPVTSSEEDLEEEQPVSDTAEYSAVPEKAVEKEAEKLWSPAIIGVTAVLIAALLAGVTYIGVIRTREYDIVSFGTPAYESDSSQEETEAVDKEV